MNVEKDQIFIGQVDDIELDSVEEFEHEEESYAIYNLSSGFYATQGYCFCGEGAQLSEGILKNEEIKCQSCGKVFSIVSGDCVSNPETQGLRVYDVVTEGNDLYLNI